MIPACSAALPTMNPGVSARNMIGKLNASQSEANAAIFRHVSGKRIPPRRSELFAMIPAGIPSMRAKAVITSRAYRPRCSRSDPSSINDKITSCMSKVWSRSAGTIDRVRNPFGRERGCAGRHLFIIQGEQGQIMADPLEGFLFGEDQLVAGP